MTEPKWMGIDYAELIVLPWYKAIWYRLLGKRVKTYEGTWVTTAYVLKGKIYITDIRRVY